MLGHDFSQHLKGGLCFANPPYAGCLPSRFPFPVVVIAKILPAVATDTTGIRRNGSAGSTLYSCMSPRTLVNDGVAFRAWTYGQRLSRHAGVGKCSGILGFSVEIGIESHQVIVLDNTTPGQFAVRLRARSHEKCSKSCGCEYSR